MRRLCATAGTQRELDDLLEDTRALLARLGSASPLDPTAVDAELSRLAARLRRSEQRLSERQPIRFRPRG